LHNIATYPASVTAMMTCVFVMTALSTIICIKFAGWNRSTALLASVPGALAYILSIIPTTNANTPRVVAVQMVRVLFLMALVPVLVAESGFQLATGSMRPDDSWLMFAAECAAGACFGFVLTRFKLAGGMLLGAMTVSALAHGFEVAHGRAPQIALISGQILIGAWSGSRFAGFDWGLFLRQSPVILGSITLSVLVAAGFAGATSVALGLPFGATFLAFSPGGFEAMAVLALAERGHFLHAPDVYMDKIAVGGGLPLGVVDLDAPVAENLRNLARAKRVDVSDLTLCILDRERHKEIIAKTREAGARIVLISDGDVAGVIATTMPESGIDIYMGWGGAPEGVLSAAALRCVDGQMQGRLIYEDEAQRLRAIAMGITDPHKKFSILEMAKGDVMFAATGVTTGSLLRGVRRSPTGATTHSMVMRSKSGTVRFIEAQHNFTTKYWAKN
jgi:fructose-1,6-bisphosphatase class II